MIRRTVAYLLAPTVASLVPAVDVERRGLGVYRQLVEAQIEEVA